MRRIALLLAGAFAALGQSPVVRSSTLQAGTPQYCASTTGNDTFTCSLTPALTAYTTGGCVVLRADTANTGPATLNVNGLGAQSILNRALGALADGDITANAPITLCYDGTQYVIQGDGGGGGGGTPGGSGTEIQYRASGTTFGGASTLSFTNSTLQSNRNNIGSTDTDGIYLENTQAATSGQAQNSPSIHLRGFGWNTAAAASESLDYFITAKPWRQSASGPSRANPGFEIGYKLNGGAYGTLFHMYNDPDGLDPDFSQPNYFLGLFTGNQTMSAGAMANIGIGTYTLTNLTTGNENTAIGHQTMYNCSSCYWNTSIGHESGIMLTSGYQNTFIGQDAGRGLALVTGIMSGEQNTHIGTQAGALTPRNNQRKSIAIGYQSFVDGDERGVLGTNGMKWSTGGLPAPDKTLVVADPSVVGSETLSQGSFSPATNWTSTGDFSKTNGNCSYAHSTGSGTCTQANANFATAMKANSWYKFTFTLSGQAGNPACSVANFPSTAYDILHTRPSAPNSPNGTWSVYFRSANSTTADFTLSCTSDSGDDAAIFDDLSLTEVQAGSFEVTGSSMPMPRGTTAPATCLPGEYFFDTDATAGQNTYACTATNTWTLQGGAGGGGLGDPGANGVVVRTALDTTTARTMTGTSNRIVVTNGDGVSGNPTFDVGSNFGELVTAGSAGTAAYNAGTATTAARSDHVHRTTRSVSWHFPGSVVAGVQSARTLIPDGVSGCILTNARMSANTTASGSSTWNIQRCTTAAGDCTATANIYSSNVTLNSSTQSVAGGTPNTTTASAGDAFRANLVSVGSGLADVTVTMAYKCETTN